MKQVLSNVIDVTKPLNIASSIEQTKAKTVLTDAQELEVAKKCAEKPEAKTLEYLQLFEIANKLAEEFRKDTSEGSYLKPKAYQIHVACDVA